MFYGGNLLYFDLLPAVTQQLCRPVNTDASTCSRIKFSPREKTKPQARILIAAVTVRILYCVVC